MFGISFFSMAGGVEEAKLKYELVQGIAQFIREGLSSTREEKVMPQLKQMENAVLAELGSAVMLSIKGPKKKEEELKRFVLTQYFNKYDNACRLYLSEQVTPTAILHWKQESEMIASRYEAGPTFDSSDFSLEGAHRVSWFNLRRAQQRYVLIFLLTAMYNDTEAGRIERNNSQVGAADAVLTALYHRMTLMEMRVLRLSLLAGGEAAEYAKQWMLKTKFEEGHSILEYINVDGHHPGFWNKNDEEGLRDSIRSCGGKSELANHE